MALEQGAQQQCNSTFFIVSANYNIQMNNIKRIVLTGGPCAGKTTALVRIHEHFSALGYKVFTVPEVPTMITQAGWNYLTDNHDFYYEGEKVILETQLELEDKIMRMAETCKEPCVIVCDRGAMDISAYISTDMWKELTDSCHTSTEELRTGNRYDAILHLVSAADGAEKFYTKPQPMQLPQTDIRLRHYGRLVEEMTEKLKTMPQGPERDELTRLTANQMKRDLMQWGHGSIDDEKVADDLARMTDGIIQIDLNHFRFDRTPMSNDPMAAQKRNKKKK
jgi:predicted ATPase